MEENIVLEVEKIIEFDQNHNQIQNNLETKSQSIVILELSSKPEYIDKTSDYIEIKLVSCGCKHGCLPYKCSCKLNNTECNSNCICAKTNCKR